MNTDVAITKEDKEKARVLRHVAKPATYHPRCYPITAEKRAYMKRFGSRPNKRKAE
jgi:hypothetical protein